MSLALANTDEPDEPRFLASPGETWAAMYADCEAAQHSIRFEQYIIANDQIGQDFIHLFIRKAKAGIKVQLILDSVGSHGMEYSPLLKELREAGGQVIIFNPKTIGDIFFPSTWFPRNHAKTMLIDASIAYVGSVCLADYMRDWRDVQVRLTGRIVDDIEADFSSIWEQLSQKRHLLHRHRRRRSFYPAGVTRYVVHKPEIRMNALFRELLREINSAKISVHMATPYFLPPRRLRAALRAARRRNVHVVMLLSDVTDVPIADCVGRSYIPAMDKMGIEVMLYTPSVMHAKYSIIDGRWATVGSTNLDYLSLWHNRETNLVTTDPQLIAGLEARFSADTLASRRVGAEAWTAASWRYRFMAYMGRFFRHIM